MDRDDMDRSIDARMRRRRLREDAPENKYRMLRQWLNIIFMLGALIGVGLYFYHDRTAGTIVILVAMIFKIVECVFRLMK
ncbi:MAG: hypothetical protein PUH24_09325 [Prevotellaceae bacterium]|nr:hypothetical protein [Prevotellaceae bacterium]